MATNLLPSTSPVYLRRLARELRRHLYRGSLYYRRTRVWRVRLHCGRIEYQPLSSSANAPRWQVAHKPDGFSDGRHDVCASRAQPRRGASCR